QPLKITEDLTAGEFIRFSYEVLDSFDCAEDIPLISITCLEPLFETSDTLATTCNFTIESTAITDPNSAVFQLEVFNQTDFGPYRPEEVRWYNYETGKQIGDTPIIKYTPPPNSPPSINICADISVTLGEAVCATTLCHTIITDTIVPQADICQALFIYQPADQLSDNGTINFYNLSFGDFERVFWDFGDGQTDTTTAATFAHIYNTPGLYEVCLTLEGNSTSCPSTFCLPVFTVGGADICTYNDCVLPGDANKDGQINIFDALNLGVGFNSMGEIRPNAVIDPILQAAFDWDFVTIFDLNFKHLDCDGNGTVNGLDYQAINQNYQKVTTEAAFEKNDVYSDVVLQFPSEEIAINPNQSTIKIPANLVLGSATKPINDFYGIALSFDYDNTLVKGIETTYIPTAFIGASNSLLLKEKHLQEEAQLGMVISRTDQEPVSGSGEVTELAFIIDLDLIEGRAATELQLDINDIIVVDHNGEEIPINVPNDTPKVTLVVDKSLTVNTVEQLTEAQFAIYPNPVKETLLIELSQTVDLSNSTLQIFNTLGQNVWTQSIIDEQTKINLDHLESGVYWVKIQTKVGTAIQEIFVE
ncbi:MAG: T9SS type A sorting domain-containing protein, partial [Bacteroidota bacterium]